MSKHFCNVNIQNQKLTLCVVGLLEHTLVKAAEGGTKIFEVREEQLLVAVRYAVLGLRGLLQAHGLGYRLWMTCHLKDRTEGR